jgi:glycosyltransferase involved in cell wall biosynthesis
VLDWLQQDARQLEGSPVPENGIELIRREHGIDRFDAVLIDGSEFTASAELDEIYGARFILLDDVNSFKNYANYQRLLADDKYVLVSSDWRVKKGFAIFALAQEMPGALRPDPLPVHFLTIVLDGEPFIRYHIDVFRTLPFEWHWHVMEGVADLVHDTAWSVESGGHVPQRYRSGRSIDGTSEYLDQLAAQYPDRVTLYRKPPGVRWDGKQEMFNTPTGRISRPSLLWEIDVDELWTAEQLVAGRKFFLDDPTKTAAYYWCWFFVGPDLLTCTRYTYGNRGPLEWLRTWRYRPGMLWASHEPAWLKEFISPVEWRDVAPVNPIRQDEAEAAGLVFQHYAYATMLQILFKEEYYGYRGAVAGWLALQAEEHFPVPLSQYFPWVKDGALVDRAEHCLDRLLLDTSPAGVTPANAPRARQPTVVVDAVAYQLDATSGIARVWKSLLEQWIADGFAQHVVILDRLGTAPKIRGYRYRIIHGLVWSAVEADRRMLQRICKEENAKAFISTDYTAPTETPSVFLVHDMIPEATGMDLKMDRWQLKHAAIRRAAAFVAVSQSTGRDLLRFFPEVSGKPLEVSPHGVDAVFRPRSDQELAGFRVKYNLAKPYFFIPGASRIPYKNVLLVFQALGMLADGQKYDLLYTARQPLGEEYDALIPPGMTARGVWLEDDELSMAYGGAAATVYPRLYEGFGMAILEAMACGCPVLTCDNSAIGELAGQAAMYVSPTDPAQLAAAMVQIQNPQVRQRLIERGLARAKDFSWPAAAATLKDVLLRTAAPSACDPGGRA